MKVCTATRGNILETKITLFQLEMRELILEPRSYLFRQNMCLLSFLQWWGHPRISASRLGSKYISNSLLDNKFVCIYHLTLQLVEQAALQIFTMGCYLITVRADRYLSSLRSIDLSRVWGLHIAAINIYLPNVRCYSQILIAQLH